MSIGVPRHQSHCGSQRCNGAIDILGKPASRSEIVMSFSQLGIQANSLLQLDDCVGQLSFDTERVTEIVMRLRLVWS